MSYNFDRIIRLTQPITEPVTLAEAKAQLRFDGTEEDALITSLISVARDYVEGFTGHYWAKATFAIFFDDFPPLDIPMDIVIPDIESIDTITYIDTNQDDQSITTGTTLDAERRWLRNDNAWPTDAISVRMGITAGVDNGSSPVGLIPNAIKQGILLVITDLYNNRASLTTMQTYKNEAVDMLIFPYRTRLGI